ncbi:leukocyte cell-derived chemotaxin 1 isoform X1 [Silurus asotus]|uniref:Leukocyte cell-derived chemotaxin 1 n=1 Tax=Silurus asotus TaxID=30991 RepID=A0AAD5FV32_SILAS|nr:leukocyte cell-derived chemotaxin 1 isoform X1 [Silurus asotus]
MEDTEKIPIALAGPEDLQQFMPPAYAAVAVKPPSSVRTLKIAVAALSIGVLLLLLGAVGAYFFWNSNSKQVYNVHYSMSIDGKVEKGSMEIDTVNNLERFKTGSKNEAVEVHDFQIGITGIRFAGEEKCYIKTEAKGRLPDLEYVNKETLNFDLVEEVMPAKVEDSLIWVAADQPLKDYSFLSDKILDLCKGVPIFWLRPTYPNKEQKEQVPRARRQAPEDNVDRPSFNPNNPYHRREEGEDGSMTVDPMLDHMGLCCAECRRSYTHCVRVCEPLGGYEPWPYHYRGCRKVCRVVMPCSWWVARIMGVV